MNDVTEQATRRMIEEADRNTRNTAEQTKRAAQANADLISGQAKALRHMWEAGSEMAANLTARSSDQVARAFGIGGAEKGASQISGNVDALMQSASAVANAAQAISTEWVVLARNSTERSVDHVAAIMRSRSPQEFVTTQTDAIRDNVELLMDSSRRIAEIALRTTEEASREIGRNLKPSKPAK